jgi:23S rRNA pseudouridine955/2504/2580 synthase
MAKTRMALSRLNYMFSQRAIIKEYLTVVVGKPAAKHGNLLGLGSVQLDPSEQLFKLKDPRAESNSRQSNKDYTNGGTWGEGVKAAATYEVLRHSSKYDLSLLRIHPSTGYKHQLRIQCTELLRCPMLGDKRYGGDAFHPSLRSRLKVHGLGTDSHPHGVLLHLHAAKLTVPGYLPDGEDLVLQAPLPDHMRLTIAACGLKHPSIGEIEHHPQIVRSRGHLSSNGPVRDGDHTVPLHRYGNRKRKVLKPVRK